MFRRLKEQAEPQSHSQVQAGQEVQRADFLSNPNYGWEMLFFNSSQRSRLISVYM
jgi:hypothetical protein